MEHSTCRPPKLSAECLALLRQSTLIKNSSQYVMGSGAAAPESGASAAILTPSVITLPHGMDIAK